ncbi:hypothetical protein HK099_007568 [Clydaea vesicula]|uniref:Uncharacterized protein n=1 Tax=Clydaea vesicula TaxID=447962 RepID=A0AAD5XYE4_9FUNG|nr:hypothetical protein HK099_007568 [Clydaea vesicula]KAJ3382344.1 hypothetical protein HDU92_004801 [Lobulomyces angularis]
MSRITITHGVVGGFMPPVPKKSAIIQVEDNGELSVTYNVKKDNSKEYNTFSGTVKDNSFVSFIDTLVSTFKTLPREDPPMSEDIYRFDHCISIDDGKGFRWENMPNQGCSVGRSTVQPTEEQRKQFKEACDGLFNLASSHAKTLVSE